MSNDDEAQVEHVARELAVWHGSAMSHANRDGEMQTVASSYVGHRWAHASTDYADKKWRQYRGAARHAIEMVAAEREACAKLADHWLGEGSYCAAAIRARSNSSD